MIEIEKKYLKSYTFIDLFAGLGGFRLALESVGAKCVYSNEWDKNAQEVYNKNFGEFPAGDMTKVDEKSVPNYDITLLSASGWFLPNANIVIDLGRVLGSITGGISAGGQEHLQVEAVIR